MKEGQARKALVLSGGGGRGAYHIGVMTYLQHMGWTPDLIVGTSIGAVNAAALGSGIPLEGLRERWLDTDTADIQYMRADDVFVDNMLMRRSHIFDTTPLLATLTDTAANYAYNLALAGFYAAYVTAAYGVGGAIGRARGTSA